MPDMKLTLRESLLFDLPAVIDRPDGTADAQAIRLRIRVESQRVDAPTAPAPILYPDLAAWVDTYLRGKNLPAVLDFPVTARNVALYLFGVFLAIDPDVHEVAVTFDAGPTYAVTGSST